MIRAKSSDGATAMGLVGVEPAASGAQRRRLLDGVSGRRARP
ncbi:hypothetical protein ACF08N_12135 [Streptomyces sp. NPDC015127]